MGKATIDDLLKEQKKTNALLKEIIKQNKKSIQLNTKECIDTRAVVEQMEKVILDQAEASL